MGSNNSTIKNFPLSNRYQVFYKNIIINKQIEEKLTTHNNISNYKVLHLHTVSYERLKVINSSSFNKDVLDKLTEILITIKDLKIRHIVPISVIKRTKEALFYITPEYRNSLINVKPSEVFKDSGLSIILLDVCGAIKLLHSKDIIHGNIKPSNILFSADKHFSLSDIAINTLFIKNKDGIPKNMDNLPYLSPEVIKNKVITKESDVWSIGCVLYFLLSDKNAFNGNSLLEIEKNILECKYEEINKSLKPELNKLIQKLLCIDPKERMSIDKLFDEIKSICNSQNSPGSGTPTELPRMLCIYNYYLQLVLIYILYHIQKMKIYQYQIEIKKYVMLMIMVHIIVLQI